MTEAEPAVCTYTIKPLGPDTWEAFARLAEKHNGVWGGCWCTWFHPGRKDQGLDLESARPYKELLVRQGRAHAALVFDGEAAVGWCEYGTPEELPNIYHRKEYEAGLDQAPTTASPACSSTGTIGAQTWPRWPCRARWS